MIIHHDGHHSNVGEKTKENICHESRSMFDDLFTLVLDQSHLSSLTTIDQENRDHDHRRCYCHLWLKISRNRHLCANNGEIVIIGDRSTLPLMNFDNTMNNWNFSSFDTKNRNISGTDRFFTIVRQQEKITSIECWFHATTKRSADNLWKLLLVRIRRTYLRTTTIGLSLPVTTINPFHIINAVETIIPKFNTW